MLILLRFTVTALTILALAYMFPGFYVEDIYTALWVAFVLGLLNTFLRPILYIFTLPLTLLTLGLFSFVISIFILWLTDEMIGSFSIDGFAPLVIGTAVIALVRTLIDQE